MCLLRWSWWKTANRLGYLLWAVVITQATHLVLIVLVFLSVKLRRIHPLRGSLPIFCQLLSFSLSASSAVSFRCQRLRIGDRILEVNDRDIRKAQHIEAVEVSSYPCCGILLEWHFFIQALKQSGPRVVLLVTHEPQPPGMRIIEVTRKDGQSLGISIHGGVGKPAANPADERDEGIFVEKVTTDWFFTVLLHCFFCSSPS